MTQTERTFLLLLRGAVTDLPSAAFRADWRREDLPDQPDWAGIFRLARIHSLVGLAAVGIMRLPSDRQPPREAFLPFRRALIAATARSAQQLSLIHI